MEYKCKYCGGDISISYDGSYGICKYCGSKNTVPLSKDSEINDMLNRAEQLRRLDDFEAAISIFKDVLKKDRCNSEAYWGIALSEYGIEYIQDPKTKLHIPTFHNFKEIDFEKNSNVINAKRYALNNEISNIYADQTKNIQIIQNKIRNELKRGRKFDVFISYKENDEFGNQTIDSKFAEKFYKNLTQKGYKVFFAKETLKGELGEFEPKIYSALKNSRIMIVLCSKLEYANSAWVKNEWKRFLGLEKCDSSKIPIPCYFEDENQIPSELTKYQYHNVKYKESSIKLLDSINDFLNSTNQSGVTKLQYTNVSSAGYSNSSVKYVSQNKDELSTKFDTSSTNSKNSSHYDSNSIITDDSSILYSVGLFSLIFAILTFFWGNSATWLFCVDCFLVLICFWNAARSDNHDFSFLLIGVILFLFETIYIFISAYKFGPDEYLKVQIIISVAYLINMLISLSHEKEEEGDVARIWLFIIHIGQFVLLYIVLFIRGVFDIGRSIFDFIF